MTTGAPRVPSRGAAVRTGGNQWRVGGRRGVPRWGGPAAAPAGWRNDVLAIVLGTAAYLAFAFWLHPWLIGVPVLPGREVREGERPDPEGIGFPLLVKAAAGGGGRGMRLVRDPAELEEAVRAARREAESGFGDGRVFLERYVARPHHLEVQILGDQHGTVVHLFERECSIQRRHQKLVEESPSTALDATTSPSLA